MHGNLTKKPTNILSAWGQKKPAGKAPKNGHRKPARCWGDVKYSEDARGAKGAN